ncbi:MAG: NosD domain-containing protein, partial [Candidatus Njordarchaeota archaeon]
MKRQPIIPILILILIPQVLPINEVTANQTPSLKIDSVNIDKTNIELGEWITVTIKATNYGYRADEMYISASIPENPPLESIEIVESDLQETYILGPGDKVWGDYGQTYPITLQYPLIEGYTYGWENQQTKTLKFKFKPHKTGTFHIYIKTTAQTGGQWKYDPTTGTKDQQNEYVYVYAANVLPKSTFIGTVYIRADGRVDPPDAPLVSLDNTTYKLTSNITGIEDGIVIERNNVVLDGANFTIQGQKTLESKGIWLSGRYNVTIKHLNIKDFYYGIFINQCSNITIFQNNLSSNVHDGIYAKRSSCNKIIENTITNNGLAIYLSYSHNNTISANTLYDNNAGISLLKSSENDISMNYLVNNTLGVWLYDFSSNNTISGNNILMHTTSAIIIQDGLNNIIYLNNITNNDYGVCLHSSRNNIVYENIIRNSSQGILITDSSNNTVRMNNISNNYYGIRCSYASYNSIYHNNFNNNVYQAQNIHSVNIWDNGYPSGGNFWSDYVGVDLNNGPYQNETGSDGIGDTPYIIDENNIDRFPLIKPFRIPAWSLAVIIYDHDGTGAGLVSGKTWVELVKEGEFTGVSECIDDHSRAVFWNVEPGTYYVNVWHKPRESVASQEFWAQKTGIVVESGKSTTVEVTRHMPIITSFEVQQAPTKINEPTSITVTIKNIDSVEQWVKAKLIIKHESGEWVYQGDSGSIAIQPGEEATFTFDDFTPNQEGTYY